VWREYHDLVGETLTIRPSKGLESASIEIWSAHQRQATCRNLEFTGEYLKAMCLGAWRFEVTEVYRPTLRVVTRSHIHEFLIGDPHLATTNILHGTKYPW
jgi:hypothetical protein